MNMVMAAVSLPQIRSGLHDGLKKLSSDSLFPLMLNVFTDHLLQDEDML